MPWHLCTGFEFVLVLEGNARYETDDGRQITLSRGEFFLSLPAAKESTSCLILSRIGIPGELHEGFNAQYANYDTLVKA